MFCLRTLLIIVIFAQSSNAQGLLWESTMKRAYNDLKKVERERDLVFLDDSATLVDYVPFTHFQLGYDCVAHAIVNSLSILSAASRNEKNQASNSLNSFSPSYLHGLLVSELEYKEGLDMNRALKASKTYGIAKIRDVEFPNYYPFKANTAFMLDKANTENLAIVKDFKSVNNPGKAEDIKWSLKKQQPCILGIQYTNSFKDANNIESWSLQKDEEFVPNSYHVVVIVGYNDNKRIGRQRQKGAFLLLNSWGNDWGINGLLWISYSDFSKLYIAAWVVENINYINYTHYQFSPNNSFQSDVDLTKTFYPTLLE